MSKKIEALSNFVSKEIYYMKRRGLLFFGVFCCLFWVVANVSAQDTKTISGGVLNDKAVTLVKPDYPPAAKAVNASGTVGVQITIDDKGNVVSARAVFGHPLLKSVSEDAAKASKFSPTTLNGTAVKVTGILVYNFAAGDKELDIKVSDSEIEQEALNDQAVKLPNPVYPAAAKAVSASGTVRVKVTLDEKGNVITAKTVSGHPLLRPAAEKAAFEAKFDPRSIKNKTVKTEGVLIYVFSNLRKNTEN